MTLKDCTKDELIWMVKWLAGMAWTVNAEYYINRALCELDFERQKKVRVEANTIMEKAKQKWDEYFSILSPYKGQKFADIPFEVLLKAEKAQKEALALDKKWNKLMGMTDNA